MKLIKNCSLSLCGHTSREEETQGRTIEKSLKLGYRPRTILHEVRKNANYGCNEDIIHFTGLYLHFYRSVYMDITICYSCLML